MSAYSDKVIADGAVAYWRLGETSGLTFADDIGNARPVTVGAATGLTYGVAGALSDGSKGLGVASVPAPGTYAPLAVGTTCTIECWLQPSTVAAGYRGIVGDGVATVGVFQLTERISVFFGGDHVSTSVLVAGTVYHVAVAITGGSGTIYFNGAPAGTFTGWPGGSFRQIFRIGANPGIDALLLDEVAIYPTTLTPQQIADHYTIGTTPPGPTPAQRRRRRFRAHAV